MLVSCRRTWNRSLYYLESLEKETETNNIDQKLIRMRISFLCFPKGNGDELSVR